MEIARINIMDDSNIQLVTYEIIRYIYGDPISIRDMYHVHYFTYNLEVCRKAQQYIFDRLKRYNLDNYFDYTIMHHLDNLTLAKYELIMYIKEKYRNKANDIYTTFKLQTR